MCRCYYFLIVEADRPAVQDQINHDTKTPTSAKDNLHAAMVRVEAGGKEGGGLVEMKGGKAQRWNGMEEGAVGMKQKKKWENKKLYETYEKVRYK